MFTGVLDAFYSLLRFIYISIHEDRGSVSQTNTILKKKTLLSGYVLNDEKLGQVVRKLQRRSQNYF